MGMWWGRGSRGSNQGVCMERCIDEYARVARVWSFDCGMFDLAMYECSSGHLTAVEGYTIAHSSFRVWLWSA